MTFAQVFRIKWKTVIEIPYAAHPRFSLTSYPPSSSSSPIDVFSSNELSTDQANRECGVEDVDYDRVYRAARARCSSAPPQTHAVNDLKIALIQLAVGPDKTKNIANAVRKIRKAAEKGAKLVVLPECFNSPYGKKHLEEYAEQVPSGETCAALSKVAAVAGVTLVGGTIPERCGKQLFNTCTVWNCNGDLVAIHRKKSLCNMDIPDTEFQIVEDEVTTFCYDRLKIGIGISNDLKLFEKASLMAQEGCFLLIYLGASNMTIEPKHRELLGRARAIDLQLWVALVSPARDTKADYTALGHTMLIDPRGKVVTSLGKRAGTLRSSVDLKTVEKVRKEIPIRSRWSAEI